MAAVRTSPLPEEGLRSRGDTLRVQAHPGVLISLLLHADSLTAETLARRLPEGITPMPVPVRRQTPEQSLLVCLAADQPAIERAFDGATGEPVYRLDQSSGRVLIELSGPAVTEALAHGIGFDLDAFSVGDSAATSYGHINVNIARTANDRFELIVMRSYARALWELLEIRCRQA